MNKIRPTTNPTEIHEMINRQVDIKTLSEQFPSLNVPAIFQTFLDVMLNGTPHKPQPNPYGYRHFGLAFRQWLRRRQETAHETDQSNTGAPDYIRAFKRHHNLHG